MSAGLRVGVLTGGGDAPGLNAAICGLGRRLLASNATLIGFRDGWRGAIADDTRSLQDANFLGYDCVLLEDACATTSPDFVRDAVLYLVRLTHGVVSSVDAVARAAGRRAPQRAATTGGRDRARGSRTSGSARLVAGRRSR